TAATGVNGTATIEPDFRINLVPDSNFNGIASINYTIQDSTGLTGSSTVSITVDPINDAPVAINDSVNATEDILTNINVLDNDSDIDGDTLTVDNTPLTVNNGVVTIGPDKTLNYTPNTNFFGSDTITYQISDGQGGIASATVNLNVIAVNDNPIAQNDSASTDEDVPINTINVLNNDSDPEGTLLNITSASALNGSSSVISGPAIDYTPNANFFGTDTITYNINDGTGGTATAQVIVTVNPINDNPVALPDSAIVIEDTLTNIVVLTNDSDIENNPLTVNSPTASHGTVVVNASTTIDYTPGSNYFGSDTITYQISDGQGGSAASSVDVTVTGVDDLPIAVMDTISVDEDMPINIDILANDSEPDGQVLIVGVSPTASNGALTVKPDKTLDYVPNVNFNGSDTIHYDISDGTTVVMSTVDVTVNPINDAPVINDVNTSIAENTANTTPVITHTGTDVDTGQALTYSIVTNSANIFGINSTSGELNISDNSSLNFETTVQHLVTVKAQDDGPGLFSDTAVITVDVTNVVENVTPTIDTLFGINGTAASNSFTTESFDLPGGSVIDSAGKLVVVGKNQFGALTITRFNTDGTLDRAFGFNGVANKDLTLSLEFTGEAPVVAIDPANNIVVAGTHISGSSPFVFAARFTSAGLVDNTFNSGGTPGYHIYAESVPLIAEDMKIHSSGAIIIAASDPSAGGFRVVKFSADGSTHIDSVASFFGGPDKATALNLQSDGKAVVSGYVFNCPSLNDFGVARFDVSSTPFLDTSYANSGTASFDFGNSTDDMSYDAYITGSDELILAGSTVNSPNTTKDFAALKIDANGTLISAFGSSGLIIEDIDGDGTSNTSQSVAKSVTSDSNGNLYFAINNGLFNYNNIVYSTTPLGAVQSDYGANGQAVFDHGIAENEAIDLLIDSSNRAILLTTTTPIVESDLAVARFNTDGVLDNAFSADGFNTLDPTFNIDSLSELIELTVAPHTGKFVAVGTAGSNRIMIVARYNSNGSIDETFGLNGYFSHTSVESTITGRDVVELNDGRLIAVGTFDNKGLVVMIKTDGTLDSSFATGGQKQITSAAAGLSLNAVAVDKANQIIVAGTDGTAASDVYMAKLSFTGVFDGSFGSGGEAKFDLGVVATIEDIAISSSDSIIGVGKKGTDGLIIKVLNNGVLDTAGFAPSDGYVSLDLDPIASVNVDTLVRVKIKSDNKIVAAGYSAGAQPTNIVIQLNPDGSVDATFDADGIVSHNYGSGGAKTFGLALDANQNILTTGFNYNGTTDDIFVAKTTATGTKDNLFNGAAGGILFDYTGTEAATAILVRPDGTLVIAGANTLNLFPTNFFFIQKLKLIEP
ncbi:MAG: putative delta-60 repeat protein, partial [Alteromonadaceae bacterium]